MRTVRELTQYLASFDPDDLICVWATESDNREGIVILPSKNTSAEMDIKYFDNKLVDIWQKRIALSR